MPEHSSAWNGMMIVGIIGGATLIIGGIYCLVGWSSKCMQCGEWFSKILVTKTKVKEEAAVRDEDRHDKHYDKYGNFTG
jgi:hypothetical protein